MNFNDKYNGNEVAALHDGFLISKEMGICPCGKSTRYLDIYSERYFCSEECYNKFYNKTDERVKKNNEVY